MKKLFGLMMVVMLCVFMITTVSVVASDTQMVPTFEVQSLTCNKGDTISIPIFMENNTGVTSVNLKIGYNSKYFTLKAVEDKGLLGVAVHSDDYSANPYTLSWENDTSTVNFTDNGKIVELVFEVKESTPAGKYSFEIEKNEQLDCNGYLVNFTGIGGTVEVKEDIIGDANSDGVLDTKDRMHISRYVADWKDYRDINVNASDVNCDGKVSSEDRMYVSRHLANWEDYDQFTYKSNGNTFKLIGIITDSSLISSTSTTVAPYVTFEVTDACGNKYGIGEPYYSGNYYVTPTLKVYVGGTDAADYIGRKVAIMVEYDEEADVITARSISAISVPSITIDIADIVEFRYDSIKYYVNESKTATTTIAIANMFYNGVEMAFDKGFLNYTVANMSGTIELALLNDYTVSGDYDTMYVTAYDVFVVDEVNTTGKRISSKIYTLTIKGDRINYDEEDGDVLATLYDAEGNEMDWEDLKENDVLLVKYVVSNAKSIYEAKIVENTITGTVTGVSGCIGCDDRYVEIDGTEYKVFVNAEVEEEMKLGDTCVFYLDDSNNIIYFTKVANKDNNYAYVVGAQAATDMETAKVKLLTKEDGITTFEVADKITVKYRGEKATNISTKNFAADLAAKGYYFDDLYGMDLYDLCGCLITFATDSKGRINSIQIPSFDEQNEDYLCMNIEGDLEDYDEEEASFRLNGKKYYITDETVVFYVGADDEDDFDVVALNNLSEDQDLHGAVIYDVDDDRYIGAIVLTCEQSIAPSVENATFVTRISDTTDEDGYDVVRVTGYKGLEEVSYICEDAWDIEIGDLVVPVYKVNGDVNYFDVVDSTQVVDEANDVEYVFGTLESYVDDGEIKSPVDVAKGKIVVDGVEYSIPENVCAYAYYYDSGKSEITSPYLIGYDENNQNLVLVNNKFYEVYDVWVRMYIKDGEVADLVYCIEGDVIPYPEVPDYIPDVENPAVDVEIPLSSVISTTVNSIKYREELGNIKTITLSPTAEMYINGTHSNNWDRRFTINDLTCYSGTIGLAKENGSTTYNRIYVDYTEVFEVKAVTDFAIFSDNSYIVYEDPNAWYSASLTDGNGNEMAWEDVEKGDILTVKTVERFDNTIYTVSVNENTLYGEVTGISGTVFSYDRYVEVDGYKFKVVPYAEFDKEIKLGTVATFYLDENDNVTYFKKDRAKNDYAYVMGVQGATAMDAAKIKMLTIDEGVSVYQVADKVTVMYKGEKTTNVSTKSSEFSDLVYDILGSLVTYKLNANGQLSAIEIPSYDDQNEDYLCLNGNGDLCDYNGDDSSFKLNGGKKYYITDETVVFYVGAADEDDYEVVALNNLSDGQDLDGAIIFDADDDRYIGAIVLTHEQSIAPSVENATFVTRISATVDEDGYDVVRVTGYKGLEEVSYICEDAWDIEIGALVVPVYKVNGDVNYFDVIDSTEVVDYKNDVEYVFGTLETYVEDGEELSPINTKRKSIIVDGVEYKIEDYTNIYVYDCTLTTRNKYKVGESLGYVEFDLLYDYDDNYAGYDLYVNGELSIASSVDVYMYIYDGDVVDLVYYINK